MAGPSPSCETMAENPITTKAALTTPKSVGDTKRARMARTASCIPAYAALPALSHSIPPTVRWVRLRVSPAMDHPNGARLPRAYW